MNDIVVRIFNIIDRVRNMEQLSTMALALFAVLAFFGVLNCLLGYRLLRFWMMLGGFFVGALLAFCVMHGFGNQELSSYLAPMVITGVVVSVIAFAVYRAGIFILGAGIGWAVSIYVIHPTSSAAFFVCILVGLGLGSMAVRYNREVIIVSTSLIGGMMAGMSFAKIGQLTEVPYGVGMSIGCALLGMLIQFAINKPDTVEAEDIPEETEKKKHHSSDSFDGFRTGGSDEEDDEEDYNSYDDVYPEEGTGERQGKLSRQAIAEDELYMEASQEELERQEAKRRAETARQILKEKRKSGR